MRDILTGLAIILIVVLTTLLVAPYFVDWNGQRAFLETQLSRAFGQTVTIGGSIDLKLLPTPYIRLNQTVIGGDEGAIRIGIHHLDLELAVAPLLHGEFDVVEGRFDQPTIRLTLQPDRTLPAFPETPALKADIRLERITVVDGTLAVADPASGRTLVVDHLDFTADAPSLAGPFKGSGAAGADAGRTRFRFATTEPKNGRTHLHLALGETGTHPGVDLDGDVALAAEKDGLRPSFDGSVAAVGHLVVPDEGSSLAWRLTGPLLADPAGAKLAGGELRLGDGDGLALKADVDGTFGADATIAATLTAQQLDIDRLTGLPVDPTKPNPPPQLPSASRLRALLAAATPGVPTRLDVTVDGATWGGEALSDLALHLRPAADGNDTLQASGDGPGGLQLAADGTLARGATGFTGQARLGAADLPEALRWLAAVAPDLAPSPRELPFARASLSGPVSVDAAGLTSKDAVLVLDRSRLQGSLALTHGARQPHLAADLRTDVLDLGALPNAEVLGHGATNLAFDVKLAAGSAKIASFGNGALQAGRVALDVGGHDGGIDLRSLRVEDLGGATLAATGHLQADKASFDTTIDAARLDAAAALARQVAPGAWSDALAARAPSLAPAHLRIDAALTSAAGGRGKLVPSRLTIDGTLAGTRVAASLTPGEQKGASALSAKVDASDGLVLMRQLGLPLASTATPVGAGTLTLAASGDTSGPLAARFDAGLGTTRLVVDGRFDLLGKGKGGSGTAELKSADVAPLLRALGVMSPDESRPVPADVAGALALGQNGVALSDLKGRVAGSGIAGTLKLGPPSGDAPVLTGTLDVDRLALGSVVGLALGPGKPPAEGVAWSAEPFGLAAEDLPRADVSLRARVLDLLPHLSATDASLDLRLGPSLVAVPHAEATLDGGHVDGAFSLRRDGRQATLEGSLNAAKVALDVPALAAGLTGKLDFAGGGGSALALVTSLAGSGEATLADVRVPGADPAALPRVFAMVEDDTLAVDEEAIDRAFDENAKAPLAAGSRPLALGLAGATLTLTPAGADGAPTQNPVSSEVGATLDLRAMRLAVRATETLHALPKDWSGPPPSIVVTQAGPLAAPRRSFDVAGFLNAVAARALARESARIEAYEFDIRERALFNARLQSEHRREADRLKAEADAKAAAEAARRAAADLARKAEAERRAKNEAARLEKQRAADDAGSAPAPTSPATTAPDTPRFDTPPPGSTSDPAAAGRY